MKAAEVVADRARKASGRCSTTWATLADPLRCRMLLVLERHELTVSELCAVLQLPQSTVSRHLKTLADAGGCSSRRDGTSRYYSMRSTSSTRVAAGCGRSFASRWPRRAAPSTMSGVLPSVLARRRSKSEEFFSSASGQWDRLREELFGQSFHLHALLGLLDPASRRRRSGLRHGPAQRVGRAARGAGDRRRQLGRHAASGASAPRADRQRRCAQRQRSKRCRSTTLSSTSR